VVVGFRSVQGILCRGPLAVVKPVLQSLIHRSVTVIPAMLRVNSMIGRYGLAAATHAMAVYSAVSEKSNWLPRATENVLLGQLLSVCSFRNAMQILVLKVH